MSSNAPRSHCSCHLRRPVDDRSTTTTGRTIPVDQNLDLGHGQRTASVPWRGRLQRNTKTSSVKSERIILEPWTLPSVQYTPSGKQRFLASPKGRGASGSGSGPCGPHNLQVANMACTRGPHGPSAIFDLHIFAGLNQRQMKFSVLITSPILKLHSYSLRFLNINIVNF